MSGWRQKTSSPCLPYCDWLDLHQPQSWLVHGPAVKSRVMLRWTLHLWVPPGYVWSSQCPLEDWKIQCSCSRSTGMDTDWKSHELIYLLTPFWIYFVRLKCTSRCSLWPAGSGWAWSRLHRQHRSRTRRRHTCPALVTREHLHSTWTQILR